MCPHLCEPLFGVLDFMQREHRRRHISTEMRKKNLVSPKMCRARFPQIRQRAVFEDVSRDCSRNSPRGLSRTFIFARNLYTCVCVSFVSPAGGAKKGSALAFNDATYC